MGMPLSNGVVMNAYASVRLDAVMQHPQRAYRPSRSHKA